MSIMYCENHDRRWDSDFLADCPRCLEEAVDFIGSVVMKVWIIEMLVNNEGVERWDPTVGCALDKHSAKTVLYEWQRRNPRGKFRIAIYMRQS